MRKIRGMKLRNTLFGSQNQVQAGYAQLSGPSKPKILAKLAGIYGRIGGDPFPVETVRALKGHLTVYVGQKDGDFHRIPVPVVYFNHPLFGELLMEAEQEFGYQHPGGITIPCGFAQFDRILTRIKSGSPARKRVEASQCPPLIFKPDSVFL